MTAQIIDRFPLILGFASMKARGICLKMFLHPFFGKKLENVNYSVTCEAITKDCWNGNPNRPFPRPGHCKKGLLAGWPLGIGLSEKWVPQNRWKTSFSGHDLAGKKKWTNLVSENSWPTCVRHFTLSQIASVNSVVHLNWGCFVQWIYHRKYRGINCGCSTSGVHIVFPIAIELLSPPPQGR